MKILLFGKSGQLGWELQRSLAPLGELVVLGSAGEGGLAGDFRDPQAVSATVHAVRPDVVVNAAAYTAVDKAEADVDIARTVNAAAPGAIAAAAQACGALMVHYSTDYVFDGNGTRPWVETDTPAPLSVYGATKLEGERLVARNCARHLILRTSWAYGSRGGNFAKTMLRLAMERDSLSVVADQWGVPTGVDLLADLTAHMVPATLRDASRSGVYHAASAGATTWYLYARFVLQEARAIGLSLKAGPDQVQPVATADYRTPARRPLNSRLDTGKLQRQFALHLPDWESGVLRMLHEIIRPQGGLIA